MSKVIIPEVVAVVEMPARAVELEREQAAAINAAYRDANRTASEAIRLVVRCGLLLLAQKAAMPHGDFTAWLEDHCPDIPDRTARHWMKVSAAACRLLDVSPEHRFGEVPLHRLLELSGDELPPLARKAQKSFFELLDGKTQKQLLFDWRDVAGGGGGAGGRRQLSAAEKAEAQAHTATETVKAWLTLTQTLLDSHALAACAAPDLLDRVSDLRLELGTALDELGK